MPKRDDSLAEVEWPDRVNYATGVLLNAEDFEAEQNYHRGRLARALRYTQGWGTLVGLEVSYEPAIPASGSDAGSDERLMISPGLAIDRLGRLIEVRKPLCLRPGIWYRQQRGDLLHRSLAAASKAWTDHPSEVEDAPAGVVADLFIRFATCENGKTPAFASGAFDTIDTVTAERLRDGYQTELKLRTEETPPVPESVWTGIDGSTKAERTAQIRERIFEAWRETSRDDDLDGPRPLAEHLAGQDTTSLFLARLVFPATEVGEGVAPERLEDGAGHIEINNALRPFVLTTNALALILDVDINNDG